MSTPVMDKDWNFYITKGGYLCRVMDYDYLDNSFRVTNEEEQLWLKPDGGLLFFDDEDERFKDDLTVVRKATPQEVWDTYFRMKDREDFTMEGIGCLFREVPENPNPTSEKPWENTLPLPLSSFNDPTYIVTNFKNGDNWVWLFDTDEMRIRDITSDGSSCSAKGFVSANWAEIAMCRRASNQEVTFFKWFKRKYEGENCPAFPDKPLAPGQRWKTRSGRETTLRTNESGTKDFPLNGFPFCFGSKGFKRSITATAQWDLFRDDCDDLVEYLGEEKVEQSKKLPGKFRGLEDSEYLAINIDGRGNVYKYNEDKNRVSTLSTWNEYPLSFVNNCAEMVREASSEEVGLAEYVFANRASDIGKIHNFPETPLCDGQKWKTRSGEVVEVKKDTQRNRCYYPFFFVKSNGQKEYMTVHGKVDSNFVDMCDDRDGDLVELLSSSEEAGAVCENSTEEITKSDDIITKERRFYVHNQKHIPGLLEMESMNRWDSLLYLPFRGCHHEVSNPIFHFCNRTGFAGGTEWKAVRPATEDEIEAYHGLLGKDNPELRDKVFYKEGRYYKTEKVGLYARCERVEFDDKPFRFRFNAPMRHNDTADDYEWAYPSGKVDFQGEVLKVLMEEVSEVELYEAYKKYVKLKNRSESSIGQDYMFFDTKPTCPHESFDFEVGQHWITTSGKLARIQDVSDSGERSYIVTEDEEGPWVKNDGTIINSSGRKIIERLATPEEVWDSYVQLAGKDIHRVEEYRLFTEAPERPASYGTEEQEESATKEERTFDFELNQYYMTECGRLCRVMDVENGRSNNTARILSPGRDGLSHWTDRYGKLSQDMQIERLATRKEILEAHRKYVAEEEYPHYGGYWDLFHDNPQDTVSINREDTDASWGDLMRFIATHGEGVNLPDTEGLPIFTLFKCYYIGDVSEGSIHITAEVSIRVKGEEEAKVIKGWHRSIHVEPSRYEGKTLINRLPILAEVSSSVKENIEQVVHGVRQVVDQLKGVL